MLQEGAGSPQACCWLGCSVQADQYQARGRSSGTAPLMWQDGEKVV